METLKASETLIEGLVTSTQDEIGNLEASNSFDLGKKEKCVESVLAPAAESGNSLVDVPIKGISLFVQLTGGVTNNGSVNESQVNVNVGQHEYRVNVGDFVWAIIKKQSWWPGIVCDNSSAPKEALKGPAKENSILVKCFGTGNYNWCLPHQLKPFVEYFEHLSKQNKSKMFIDALENSVVEFGQRVKAEFTCSCFSKSNLEKMGDIGEISVSRFEPEMFLDYINDLARNIFIPSKIDYAVKQNCLSAFYSSLGHPQIPIHELKPENGVFDENSEKSEKYYKTRERKKSRFLSYPGEIGIEESKVEIDGVDLSQTVKKPRKKRCKKIKEVLPNVCSSEVLSQLQFAGQNCLFPFESKNFDSVQRFICGFRKWVFNDFANEIAIEAPAQQIVQETLPKKVRKKKVKSVISPTLATDLNHGSLIIDFQNIDSISHETEKTEVEPNQRTVFNFGDLPVTEPTPPVKPKPKKRKKKVENNGGPPPIVNGHVDPFFVHVIPQNNDVEQLNQTTLFHFTNGVELNHNEPQFDIIPSGSSHEPKKRGRKRKNTDLQTNPGSTVTPNLNENGSEKKSLKRVKKSKEIGVPCIDLSYNKVQQDNGELTGTAFLLKFSLDHPLPSTHDLNSVFSKYGSLIESETQILTENLSGQVVFLESSSAGDAFWGLQTDQPFGPALVNYRIQHLACSESTANFKTPTMTQNSNRNSNEIKLVKRSKTIEEIQLPSMDNNNQDVTGTALLLKFSPNYPLPTYQDLNSVFRKYGELNEFETRVSGQTYDGQVVFVNPSLAGTAVQNLEKDRPFGLGLLGYRVDHLYSVQPAIRFKDPINVVKPHVRREETRDLSVIKKNLEMMKLMLEKAGDSLSKEMREKLEREIRGLMNKVKSMDGSSSSSL